MKKIKKRAAEGGPHGNEKDARLSKGLDFDIIKSYHYLSTRGKSYYSQSSQMRMIANLKRLYSQQICRRTLCYHLRYLEDSGFIKRIKRHKASPEGKILFHTTIVIPLKKALQAIAGVRRWFTLVKWKNFNPAEVERKVLKSEVIARMTDAYRRHVFKT